MGVGRRGSHCPSARRTAAGRAPGSAPALGSLKMSARRRPACCGVATGDLRPGVGVPCWASTGAPGSGWPLEELALGLLRVLGRRIGEQPDGQAAALAAVGLGVFERRRQVVRVHVEDHGDAARGEPLDRVVDRLQVVGFHVCRPGAAGCVGSMFAHEITEPHRVEAEPLEVVELLVGDRQVAVAARVGSVSRLLPEPQTSPGSSSPSSRTGPFGPTIWGPDVCSQP